jgi:hypothetical protein
MKDTHARRVPARLCLMKRAIVLLLSSIVWLTACTPSPEPSQQPVSTHQEISPTGTMPSPSPSIPATALDICTTIFAEKELQAWAKASVADFRDFHLSGPEPIYTLKDMYSDQPDSTVGAWCGTRQAETTTWWAVIVGEEPKKALSVTGPNEDEVRGEIMQIPPVP